MTINSPTLHNLSQVVKPYDPSSMPEPVATSTIESVMPIIIIAGIVIVIVIVLGIFLHRKRR